MKIIENKCFFCFKFFFFFFFSKSQAWPILLQGRDLIGIAQVSYSFFSRIIWGCPHGVMVKMMNCGIIVSEFVLQSRYYVHFRANTLGKGMTSYGLNSTTTLLLGEWL